MHIDTDLFVPCIKCEKVALTYPNCASVSGTSIEFDERRLSFAMSANFAKSVSESAKRAERLDSTKRISSRRFLSSIGG